MGSNANLEVQRTCRRWTFKHLRISTAVLISEEHCPKCRIPQLVIARRGELLAVVRLIGRDLHSLYQTLRTQRSDLSADELQDIVKIAMLVASHSNRTDTPPATERSA